MTYFVLNEYILFRKGVFLNIGEHLYVVYYFIISYLRIKVYRVETMDVGRFCCNNGVSVKYNPSKYGAIYCTG